MVTDPNQIFNAIKLEQEQIIEMIKDHKLSYLEYRGSSFDSDGNLLWAKDDASAYSEALDKIIEKITKRILKSKQQ